MDFLSLLLWFYSLYLKMKVLRLKGCMLVKEKECMYHLFKKLRRFAQPGVPNVVYFDFSDKTVSLFITVYQWLVTLCHINQIIEKKKKTLITDIFPIHIAAWKKWLFQEKGKYWSIISVASSQNQFHLYNGYFIHVWTCFLPHIFILYLSTWDVVKIKLFFFNH